MNDKTLPVTSPLLPPLDEFIPYLEQIWRSRLLTNGGAMHKALEQALCAYLGVEHIALFANGTLALLSALQALRITGEVITTPYSFVATSHALSWNGLKPVFVDIDEQTLNLDPKKIEAAITPRTTAILPVHCYGNPCAVDEIQRIADAHSLRIIYDAAHAFAVRDDGGSILRYGDLSVLSFHATKVFNTFEGGAIICPDEQTKQHIDHLKNFGFLDEVTVLMPGINGKLNEVSAAFGLLQLKHIDQALVRRREIDRLYRKCLAGLEGVQCLEAGLHAFANNAYFPILVEADFPLSRDELYQYLRDYGVLARRYFYPLISDFPMYHELPSAAPANLPVARSVAERVICLPIYPSLSNSDVERVVQLIVSARKTDLSQVSEHISRYASQQSAVRKTHMSQQQFIENFLSATDFQNPVEVTMDTVLADLPEWDSLAALGVIVMFDLEYGKTITGEDLEAIVNLGELYALTGQ